MATATATWTHLAPRSPHLAPCTDRHRHRHRRDPGAGAWIPAFHHSNSPSFSHRASKTELQSISPDPNDHLHLATHRAPRTVYRGPCLLRRQARSRIVHGAGDEAEDDDEGLFPVPVSLASPVDRWTTFASTSASASTSMSTRPLLRPAHGARCTMPDARCTTMSVRRPRPTRSPRSPHFALPGYVRLRFSWLLAHAAHCTRQVSPSQTRRLGN